MCGIYGIFDSAAPLTERHTVWAQSAQTLLAHRGPDGHNRTQHLGNHALLGHCRLSIIDIEGGTQPIANEDNTVWVICNGEIYNYVELRQELIAKGHKFRTNSDTEVLVHLYEDKGDALVDALEGMFAFAILDERRRRMLLARDRFGEKPLYWAALDGGAVAFASEMKALTGLPGIDLRLDVAAVAQFLAAGYIPAPRTHRLGIRKLVAGEAMAIENGTTRRWRYWTPQFSETQEAAPRREAVIEEVRRRVRESVRLRLRSDVPVGAFLSGGIDSTAIACAIRELLPDAKFSTFCASFEDGLLDEAPYARMVAERLGSDHHEVHFRSDELLPMFTSLIDHYDEPFGDCSMFPTYAVCRKARQLCTVMLSGDGGDECFAGYSEFFNYYRWNGLRRFPGMNQLSGTAVSAWQPGWRGRGLLTFLSQTDDELMDPATRLQSVLQAFRPEWKEAAAEGLSELEAEANRHMRLPYPLSAMEATVSAYLPEQILVKVDRASMLTSLECRAPFLDTSLFEYLSGLPVDYHFARGHGKALLREALPTWIPDEIRWRNKRGFTPPLSSWLRSELRQQMEDALANFPLQDVLDTSKPKRQMLEHQRGGEHTDELFRWLVLARHTVRE